MAVVKCSGGVVSKFPVLATLELNNVDFSAGSGILNINANTWVTPTGILNSNNALVYNDAFAFSLQSSLPVGSDVAILKNGNRHLTQRKYIYDVVQVYANNNYMKLHFRYYNGTSITQENMIYNGAEPNIITNAVYGAAAHNVAFAVILKDTTHNLTGVALYIGFAVKWSASNFSYDIGQPSFIFVQETLKNSGEQFFDVDYDDFPSDDFGDPSDPDGYGQGESKPAFDHTSDTIGIPDKPSVSITTAGFYHAYKVTQGLLQNFGAKLFPSIGNIIGGITGINDTKDVLEVLTNFLISPALFTSTQIVGQNISVIDMLLNGKAIDYVVDCHIIPVSPSVGGSDHIKCGARELDISAPVITDDYIDFDAGSISIPENFQNYIDFHGTRAKLFLVGVGFVDIKPEFWNGGTLSVKYRFNILDGSFMCYVSSTSGKSQLANTVIGQYGGCMCLHIPVTGVSYASMISGLVTGSMSLAGNVASGNAVGAVGSALTVANAKPSLAQSNNYNSSTAFLGVRRPYLQIERQVPTFSARYAVENGLPLNVTMTIGELVGFTIIENPILNLTCDDEEREEIYRLLQSGVIF